MNVLVNTIEDNNTEENQSVRQMRQPSNISRKYHLTVIELNKKFINLPPDKQPKQEQIPKKQDNNTTERYKSFSQIVGICMILAISAFQFGYTLSQVSTIPFTTISRVYKINLNLGLAEGIVNGILPIGGIFGSLCNRIFIQIFTRKMAHHPVNLVTVIASVLCLIPTMETLLIGRFLVGFSCGLYTAMAPVYIKDISPKNLRPTLGTFFSNGRVVGIVFCYALGIMCSYVCPNVAWYIMFSVPGIMAILQSVCIIVFVPNSPPEMLLKNRSIELREALQFLYKQQFIDDVINDYKKQYQKEIPKRPPPSIKEQLIPSKDANIVGEMVDYSPNRKRAFLMALHISLLRQMIGTNYLVVYANQAMQPIDPKIAPFTALIINFIQLCCGIVATLYITRNFGRRTMLLFGASTLAVQNFGIGAGFYLSNEILILVFMVLMMMSFGSFFSPVSWPYPTEIIPPKRVPYTTFLNWLGVTIITVFPPIILQEMPNNNAYPIFMFFGAYSFLSSIYIYFYAIETKGLTYQQIVAKY